MQHTYGILNNDNCHIDVSKTERGAKNYATRHGFTAVSRRFNNGYHVELVSNRDEYDTCKNVDYN